MTLGELYRAVCYLGFETRMEDEALRRGFYAVLGRALQSVDQLRPRKKTVTVAHVSPRIPMRQGEPICLSRGEVWQSELPSEGRVLALSVSGTGVLRISDASGEREIAFSSLGEHRITERVLAPRRLILECRDAVVLGALVLCTELSPLAEVSAGHGFLYDVGRVLPDFGGFTPQGLTLNGRPYRGEHSLAGSCLTLPENAPSGLYAVECRLAMPSYREGDDPDLELPLEACLAALLPELIASMIWLDDAPEKAAYYASVYQRGYALLRSSLRDPDPVSVECPNGW